MLEPTDNGHLLKKKILTSYFFVFNALPRYNKDRTHKKKIHKSDSPGRFSRSRVSVFHFLLPCAHEPRPRGKKGQLEEERGEGEEQERGQELGSRGTRKLIEKHA